MLVNREDQSYFRKRKSFNLGGELISLDSPIVMGILNITPDSFYDGGKYLTEKGLLTRAEQIINEGGKIIDVGAYSTRPGARDVTVEEEVGRLAPALKIIRQRFPEFPLSIDTFRSEVARTLINDYGPCIINDIAGGTMDDKMFATVAGLKVPYVLMHMQGTPATMQKNPVYSNVVNDVIFFLSKQVEKLKLLGVNDIIIDPGFGFGKLTCHNYELMNRLDAFKIFKLPLLAGVSRKGMVWKTLNIKPEEALNGTTVLNTMALLGNADILRVHDVKEAVQTIKIVEQLRECSPKE
jgi:dihydropteroate synthase